MNQLLPRPYECDQVHIGLRHILLETLRITAPYPGRAAQLWVTALQHGA